MQLTSLLALLPLCTALLACQGIQASGRQPSSRDNVSLSREQDRQIQAIKDNISYADAYNAKPKGATTYNQTSRNKAKVEHYEDTAQHAWGTLTDPKNLGKSWSFHQHGPPPPSPSTSTDH